MRCDANRRSNRPRQPDHPRNSVQGASAPLRENRVFELSADYCAAPAACAQYKTARNTATASTRPL